MKKFLIALSAAFVLCVPAFATDNFASLPVNIRSGLYQNINYNSSKDIYACVRGNQVLLWSLTSNAFVSRTGVDSGGHTVSSTVHFNQSVGDYYIGDNVDSVNLSDFVSTPAIVPFPSTTTDAQVANALTSYLFGNTVTSTFTVPRGNVLYFQVSSNSDVTFESHFSENSGLFSSGNVYGPWGDTYQRISTEASLPVAGIEFPRSGSSAIVWEKGDPLNVLGQTKTGVYTDTFQTGTYYAFYNPAYQSITSSDGFGSASVGSNVTVSGNFSFIRIYSLQQLYDISTSTNDYDDYYVGTPDDDGGVTWVDQDDQVNYPSSGGENQEDEPISSVSLIESIKRILRNILSEIESIFTFGFSAIRDLVDLMDEFVATFDDLYEWLPDECYTLLIACVSVAIAIGVFKVFL